MRILVILASVWLFTGCATAGKINRISLGMTKSEVIEKLGDPDSTKASQGVEVLVYQKYATDEDAWGGRNTEYWVIFTDGKVRQYGKAGDFGSSAPDTRKLIISNQ